METSTIDFFMGKVEEYSSLAQIHATEHAKPVDVLVAEEVRGLQRMQFAFHSHSCSLARRRRGRGQPASATSTRRSSASAGSWTQLGRRARRRWARRSRAKRSSLK